MVFLTCSEEKYQISLAAQNFTVTIWYILTNGQRRQTILLPTTDIEYDSVERAQLNPGHEKTKRKAPLSLPIILQEF